MEKEKNNKTLMILMIICVCLSIATLGLVIYDRFIRKEPEHAILKPIEGQLNCPVIENTTCNCQGEMTNSDFAINE